MGRPHTWEKTWSPREKEANNVTRRYRRPHLTTIDAKLAMAAMCSDRTATEEIVEPRLHRAVGCGRALGGGGPTGCPGAVSYRRLKVDVLSWMVGRSYC